MTTGKSQPDDVTQIRALRDRLTEALRSKDAEGVVSCFAQQNVMFTLAPPLQSKSGSSPGQQGVEEWFAGFDGPLGYEVRDLQITAGADVAFCHSLCRMSGRKRAGEQVDLWLRETLGLRKLDGEWKIAHQHESVPFYMDGNLKAAVDLKP